ncbi:MAG: GNAT family N-acetyltransferase [Mycobacteriales bacterium]
MKDDHSMQENSGEDSTRPDIRPARLVDLPSVATIITQARLWQQREGLPLAWSKVPESTIQRSVEHGTAVLVWVDGSPVATASLEWEDRDVWHDFRQEDAGYIHRVATLPTSHNLGLAAQLLDWADAEVVRRQRRYLRCDAVAANSRLCAYYRKRGFQPRGEALLPGWSRASMRFERIAEARR